MLSEPLVDPALAETNNDEGFEYYLKAKKVVDSFPSESVEAGSPLKQDFMNIITLTTATELFQFSRTSHLDPNGGAKEATELYSQWKPFNIESTQTFEYITQIVNDIDVKYNGNGEGKVYGVTHSLDGDKVDKVEKFVKGE